MHNHGELLRWLEMQEENENEAMAVPSVSPTPTPGSAPSALEPPPVHEHPSVSEPLDHPQASSLSSSSGVTSAQAIFEKAPSHQCTPPQADGNRRFNRDDQIYKTYVPFIAERIEPVRSRRGAQMRKKQIASVCTGSSPEDRTYYNFDIEVTIQFLCDNASISWNFCKANNKVEPLHFFVDFKALADSGLCECLIHDGEKCTLPGLDCIDILDMLFGGISCKGYSYARTGRHDNWTQHRDTWMLEAFLAMLLSRMPRFGLVENVLGFLKRDKQGNESPLLRLLRRCIELGVTNHYWIIIYILTGDSFQPWVRRRLMIGFFKKSEGEKVMQAAIAMTEDLSSFGFHRLAPNCS